eukprot:UN19856
MSRSNKRDPVMSQASNSFAASSRLELIPRIHSQPLLLSIPKLASVLLLPLVSRFRYNNPLHIRLPLPNPAYNLLEDLPNRLLKLSPFCRADKLEL